MSAFTKITAAKRAVREDLYRNASTLITKRHPKVLMLAGPEPAEEISCARRSLKRPQITAADIGPTAQANLGAAAEAGAERVYLGNVTDAFGRERFDFANLDFCKVVGSDTLWTVRKLAPKIGVLAVFVSYGRNADDAQELETRARNYPFGLKQALAPFFQTVSIGRVVAIQEATDFTKEIIRVYRYMGGVPMLGVVLASRGAAQWTPFFKDFCRGKRENQTENANHIDNENHARGASQDDHENHGPCAKL
jgi:hypothetical protein